MRGRHYFDQTAGKVEAAVAAAITMPLNSLATRAGPRWPILI